MYLCTRNYDLKRGGTFETAKAGTFHSVTAGTSIPLFTNNGLSVSAKKDTYFFVLRSILCNFVRFLSFSLYKGSLGN